MRLLIYTAAFAVVLFALGFRVEQMQDEMRRNHASLVAQQARVEALEWQMQELYCVHIVFEDGSAVHPDAELSHECLQRTLGWP